MNYFLFDDMSGNITCFFIPVTEQHMRSGIKGDQRKNLLCAALRDAKIPIMAVHHKIIFDNRDINGNLRDSVWVDLPMDIRKLHVDWINGINIPEFFFYIAFQYGKPIAISSHSTLAEAQQIGTIPYEFIGDSQYVTEKRLLYNQQA